MSKTSADIYSVQAPLSVLSAQLDHTQPQKVIHWQ